MIPNLFTDPLTYGETEMHSLMIKDLSTSLELDRKAMTAVRGGLDDQNNAAQLAAAITKNITNAVGNGSVFNGPTNINADVVSNDTVDASIYQYNKEKFGFDLMRGLLA
jgi:hypothetical protein